MTRELDLNCFIVDIHLTAFSIQMSWGQVLDCMCVVLRP